MNEICAVKDRAIEAFGQPIFVKTIGQAIRSFTDEINRKDSELNVHPDDYDLYHLGHYDETTGYLTQIDHLPKMIMRGKDAKTEPSE